VSAEAKNLQNKDHDAEKMGLQDWLQCLVIALLVSILLFVFVARIVAVEGTSMVPTFLHTDKVLISDLFYRPSQGDVVVLQTDSYGDEPLIKRVIALEGDAVTIVKKQGTDYEKPMFKVCVVEAEDLQDGKIEEDEIIVLEEEYIASYDEWTYSSSFTTHPSKIYDAWFEHTYITGENPAVKKDEIKQRQIRDENGIIYTVVPEGEFFYLGDNRAHSSDSRERGTDHISSISGVVQIYVKDAASSGAAIFVQIKEVFSYYGNAVAGFFENLWGNMKNSFKI